MMFIFLLFVSLALGMLVCFKLLKNATIFNYRLLLNLSLPTGIGIISVIFIVLSLIKISAAISCLFIIAITGIYSYKAFKKKSELRKIQAPDFKTFLQHPITLIITIIYLYALLINVGIFFFDSIKEPHGLWDAFNYWNLKAKIIAGAPTSWPKLLHQMNSDDYHPDYPLLQTGYIALAWILTKSESVWIPITLSFLFTFCTIGLLASSVSFFTTKTKGLLAGLILLCTPFYMTMGDSQYADNTVGFFYLATVFIITCANSKIVQSQQAYIAAGLTAGLSAWSKNEGLLFILCLFVSQATRLFFLRDRKETAHELKYLFYGMLPVLLLVIYHKMYIAPANDIIQAQGEHTLTKLADIERYTFIGSWFSSTLGTFGKWWINPWWLFVGGAIYAGVNLKNYNKSLITNSILILLMLAGFFLIYVISPHDLQFHLSTSLHRLFFQLFPTFIFVFFLALKNRQSSV